MDQEFVPQEVLLKNYKLDTIKQKNSNIVSHSPRRKTVHK